MAEITPTNATPDPIADAIAFIEGRPDRPAPEPVAEQVETPVAEETPAAETPPAVENPAEAKPAEALPAHLAELAEKDKFLQTQRAQLKSERDAILAEKAAIEAERLKWTQEKGVHETVERLARTDLVSLAEKYQVPPADRMKLAIELWNSAQPAEKQAPEFREKAQQRTQNTELADRLARLEAENQAFKRQQFEQAQRAEAQRIQAKIVQSVGETLTQVADKAPYTAAMLQNDPDGVREDLWTLAQEHWKNSPDVELTSAMLVERYEPLLAAKFEPLKKVLGSVIQPSKTTSQPQAEKKPSTTLSATRTATATKVRQEPVSQEEIIADAASWLESLQKG